MGFVLSRQSLRIVAILWIASLIAVSLQPYRPPGETHSARHRVMHVLAFGAGALMLMALGTDGKRQALGALIILSVALAIEMAQQTIYKGPFEWGDVRDDAIGILIAALAIRRTRVRRLLLSG